MLKTIHIRILSVQTLLTAIHILSVSVLLTTSSKKSPPTYSAVAASLQHWLSDFNTPGSLWHRCRCCLFPDVCHN